MSHSTRRMPPGPQPTSSYQSRSRLVLTSHKMRHHLTSYLEHVTTLTPICYVYGERLIHYWDSIQLYQYSDTYSTFNRQCTAMDNNTFDICIKAYLFAPTINAALVDGRPCCSTVITDDAYHALTGPSPPATVGTVSETANGNGSTRVMVTPNAVGTTSAIANVTTAAFAGKINPGTGIGLRSWLPMQIRRPNTTRWCQ